MLDRQLRPYAEVLLNPLVCSTPRRVTPTGVTIVGLLFGLGAAYYASIGDWESALWLFGINRALDGVDGLLARTRDMRTTSGAYLDFLADTLVYVTVPIGIGHELGIGLAAGVLVASFAANIVTWMYPIALGLRTADDTSGLIEGTETMLFFAAMLAFPEYAEQLMWTMAALVVATAVIRAVTIVRSAHEPD